jgi:predicted phage-related endonuclease
MMPKSEAFIADMVMREKAFWETYIVPGSLPEPSGLEAEDDYLMQLYGGSKSADIITLGGEYRMMAERHSFINNEIKRYEAEKEEIKGKFKNAIGQAKGALVPGYKATWSRFSQEKFDLDSFKVENPELFQKYRREAAGSRFTITAVKEK